MPRKIRLIPPAMRLEPELIVLLQIALGESSSALMRTLTGLWASAMRGSAPSHAVCDTGQQQIRRLREQLAVISELFDEPLFDQPEGIQE